MRRSRITSAQDHPRYEQVEGDGGTEADDNNLFHLATRQVKLPLSFCIRSPNKKLKAGQPAQR
jgi:hypothetical protein